MSALSENWEIFTATGNQTLILILLIYLFDQGDSEIYFGMVTLWLGCTKGFATPLFLLFSKKIFQAIKAHGM